ncbi:hypothetical protein HD597_000818 [Nonomuraea thailandensis]|uniref:Uncharacterized protein n=1 Tax=Nonomuraea thailandensis TaxID=1188745 RepID=A0A9X2JYG6_9ACTN|nr:hypothetical protein [Nonomuraea thailandensis]
MTLTRKADEYESVCLRDAWHRGCGVVGLQDVVRVMEPGQCAEWDAGTWTWRMAELKQE